MKKINFIICSISISLLSSCETELSNSSSCAVAFRGKIVSTTNPCAGVAIQILSEQIPTGIADAEWSDTFKPSDQISPYVFTNVFKAYPCDIVNDLNDLLKYDEVTGKFLNKGEFLFYINSDSSLENSNDGCSICKPLVPLPKKRNRIILTYGCNDLIVI